MKKILTLFLVCICLFTFSACSGESKPPKEKVINNLARIYEKELGVNNEEAPKFAKAYAKCVVGEAFDDTSASTLKAIANAKTIQELNDIKGSKDEQSALEKASNKCQGKLIPESEKR